MFKRDESPQTNLHPHPLSNVCDMKWWGTCWRRTDGGGVSLLSKGLPSPFQVASSFPLHSFSYTPQYPLSKRANLFPQVTDLFCRLPLPTLPYLTRGFSPRGPAAVIGTAWQENNSIPSFFKDRCFCTKQRVKRHSKPHLPPLFIDMTRKSVILFRISAKHFSR